MPTPNPFLEQVTALSKGTMVEHLGIEFLEASKERIKAKMPVDHRTVQPFRLLHGGASVSLAETIGSIAGQMQAPQGKTVVGIEINANHLKSAYEGQTVYGVTKPIRIGSYIQVWNIEITNEEDQLICISRLTLAVIDRKQT